MPFLVLYPSLHQRSGDSPRRHWRRVAVQRATWSTRHCSAAGVTARCWLQSRGQRRMFGYFLTAQGGMFLTAQGGM